METPGGRHVYHLYTVRARNRAPLQRALQKFGVQTGVHYPVPVHLQRAWSELGHRRGDFPVSERAAAEVLSLPMYPELAQEDVDRVTRVLAQAARRIADRIAAAN